MKSTTTHSKNRRMVSGNSSWDRGAILAHKHLQTTEILAAHLAEGTVNKRNIIDETIHVLAVVILLDKCAPGYK